MYDTRRSPSSAPLAYRRVPPIVRSAKLLTVGCNCPAFERIGARSAGDIKTVAATAASQGSHIQDGLPQWYINH
jgi:hypothetical protein